MAGLKERLAELLWSYGMDGPHWGEPPGTGYYPEVAWDRIAGFLREPHSGDCVRLPAPCVRCHAEECVFQAEWMAARLGITEPEEPMYASPTLNELEPLIVRDASAALVPHPQVQALAGHPHYAAFPAGIAGLIAGQALLPLVRFALDQVSKQYSGMTEDFLVSQKDKIREVVSNAVIQSAIATLTALGDPPK